MSSIAFSPDSTKLAVAQTDGIVYLYKVGSEFKQKKSISNKVMQPFGVLKVLWPNEFEIICGLMDGKLRHTPVASSAKTLRSRTFYNPDSQIVALITKYVSHNFRFAHSCSIPYLQFKANADCQCSSGWKDRRLWTWRNRRPDNGENLENFEEILNSNFKIAEIRCAE